MGWVTLTLRKKELKSEHAYYQLRDLQISREKRQMARQKAMNTSIFQLEQKKELAALRNEYMEKRDDINEQTSNLREANAGLDSETQKTQIDLNKAEIEQLHSDLSDAQFEYQQQVDEKKTYYEGEFQMIEEEAATREAELDQEQVDVEAQMEAISQEMQAVSDAISNEIQNSTIKLS